MSKPGGSAGEQNSGAQEMPMPFEEALKKLEAIVESMESDELSLEMLLSKFEEGTRLAQACQAKLAEAEVRIQQLEKNASGEITLKSFTLTQISE
jgi:exodeoxyribonuclease VII small subunit